MNESKLISQIELERKQWEKQNTIATSEENTWYEFAHIDSANLKGCAMREAKARKAMAKHESNYNKLIK